MKTGALILLLIFCYSECRKVYAPIDKNANLAFINMEAGGMRANNQPPKTGPAQAPVVPTQKPASAPHPQKPASAPQPQKPASAPQPQKPASAPQPQKPASPPPPQPPNTIKAVPAANPTPAQIKPVPVNPSPVTNPITTPGPGSVKHLINFYDSQGKASLIRPYSYSQAVKQG